MIFSQQIAHQAGKKTVRVAISSRKVPAKEKLKTFLQPRVLLEKFRLFTVQIRHFAGENIARIAKRVRAMALSLLQLRVLRLGFLQDEDVGDWGYGNSKSSE